jgi:hypothetical protein
MRTRLRAFAGRADAPADPLENTLLRAVLELAPRDGK